MSLITKEQMASSQAEGQPNQLSFSVPLPKDRYACRVKDCTFGQSKSSGNPMLTLVAEIFSPEEVTAVNGKKYSVAGSEFTMYFSLQEQALFRLLGGGETVGFMEALGLQPAIDPENPETKQFVGRCFSAVLGSEKRENRKDPTPEQLAAGIKQGDVILKEDGSPDIGYAIKLIGSITPTSKQPKTPLNPF